MKFQFVLRKISQLLILFCTPIEMIITKTFELQIQLSKQIYSFIQLMNQILIFFGTGKMCFLFMFFFQIF